MLQLSEGRLDSHVFAIIRCEFHGMLGLGVCKIHESSAVQKKLRNCQIRLIRSHCVQRSYLTAAAPADGAAAAAERSS